MAENEVVNGICDLILASKAGQGSNKKVQSTELEKQHFLLETSNHPIPRHSKHISNLRHSK